MVNCISEYELPLRQWHIHKFLLYKDKTVLFITESHNLGFGKDFKELSYVPLSAKTVTPLGQGSYFLLPLQNVHNAERKAGLSIPLNNSQECVYWWLTAIGGKKKISSSLAAIVFLFDSNPL